MRHDQRERIRRVVVTLLPAIVIGAAVGYARGGFTRASSPPPHKETAWDRCFKETFNRLYRESIDRALALDQQAINELTAGHMGESERISAQAKAEEAWQSGNGIGFAANEACKSYR
jgi:hypothetical protein